MLDKSLTFARLQFPELQGGCAGLNNPQSPFPASKSSFIYIWKGFEEYLKYSDFLMYLRRKDYIEIRFKPWKCHKYTILQIECEKRK